jgi:hypothetical protein
MTPRAQISGSLLVLLVLGSLLHPAPCWTESCDIYAVAVDTSLASATTHLGLRCGEAGGQVFLAADTLIRSVAVWRRKEQTPYGGYLKLWITETDSAGTPLVDRKVLDGPAITVPCGDGIHPIKMEWTFEPAFVLPRRGKYFLAAQDWCGGHWDLLVSEAGTYDSGMAWRSGITCFDPDGCSLWRPPNAFSWLDLVFTIEFCQASTPVFPVSWGRLKVIYR